MKYENNHLSLLINLFAVSQFTNTCTYDTKNKNCFEKILLKNYSWHLSIFDLGQNFT